MSYKTENLERLLVPGIRAAACRIPYGSAVVVGGPFERELMIALRLGELSSASYVWIRISLYSIFVKDGIALVIEKGSHVTKSIHRTLTRYLRKADRDTMREPWSPPQSTLKSPPPHS